MASSIAAFDACLNCTTSFMWWVMSSNSDEYGSSISKTYGAVIRFYAPVPQKEDTKVNEDDCSSEEKRSNRDKVGGPINESSEQLWCPLGICLTSSLPIVGILEALLLRLCEKLASSSGANSIGCVKPIIHADILNLILNYQRPIPGVVNCSIPFLSNEADRLLVSIPPIDSLPPLPHGASVTSVCRLLGAEGLTAILAAVLTECKILIHSADVANLAMVGEVITALMYPFQWQLPYIPVLPLSMIEVVEAPVSYFIGIPTCNMKWIDKSMLPDVVVIDLDNGFSSPDYFDVRYVFWCLNLFRWLLKTDFSLTRPSNISNFPLVFPKGAMLNQIVRPTLFQLLFLAIYRKQFLACYGKKKRCKHSMEHRIFQIPGTCLDLKSRVLPKENSASLLLIRYVDLFEVIKNVYSLCRQANQFLIGIDFCVKPQPYLKKEGRNCQQCHHQRLCLPSACPRLTIEYCPQGQRDFFLD